ncbi:MAG: 16S rRNA (cytosine(1402)-N(4))-methyltransferase RsmH [Patescibacteria group bacterium]|nr:16S rRNA (cytosine(1402)-N(4))-methyltransferase RsmH [Patescibacteria group bacterium]
MSIHTPVLLKETVDALVIKKGGKYIDATVGEGGHLMVILKKGGKVLGIDCDEEQIENLKLRIKATNNLKLVVGNFKDIDEIARKNNFFPVDGILFDLGLSMRQINYSGRGFSYKRLEEPLDMRLTDKSKITAEKLINSLPKEKLYEILAKYSEELNSWRLVEAIIRTRRLKKIKRVADLVYIIRDNLKINNEKVLARVFQSLRIAVNNEFENLKEGLEKSLKIIKKGGRIVVISFHSLEDRMVKNFIKENSLKTLEKKPIQKKEGKKFERSAKLRVIVV